MTIADIYV